MACRYIYKGKTYEAHEFDDVLRAMPPSEASKYMPTVQSVPDAPFTKSTDAWVALALKRVIKMAVDGGYDKVAFINGEQSAERFSLDRQLDSLTYEKKANGNYEVLVEMKNDAFGTPRVIGENLTPAEVEAQVGKEILARMEAGEGEPLKLGKRTSYVLKGDGLKIEARGMRAFYDSIVPAATKTLLKKLGGGQMEMVQLPTHGETKSQWSLGAFDASTAEIKQRAPGVFQVWVPNETSGVMQVRGGNFDTRAAAEAYIGSMAKGQTLQQPGFTLTPALKEAVDDGLPLFSQTETPQFKKWFGDSKVVGADGKPLVVYHGMQSDLRGGAFNGRRIYFTADPAYASGYAPEYGEASNVVPAYLSLQNPVDYTSLGKGDVSLTDFAAYLQKRGISSEAAGISAADLRKPPPGFKPQPIWAWMHSDKLRAASIEAGYDGAVIEEIGGPGETTAYIAFRPEQIKSAIGNSGEFDSTNPDIRFSQPPGATFDSPEPSRWSDIVYELLNKQIDLKDVTKRIVASGVVLADRTNAYLRDTLFAGRVDARVKELERNHVLPLLTEMRAAGVSMKDFGTYLHARHAEERNLEMQARNLNMPNNDALSGMSTPDARAILAKASPVMARLAARVDAIIEADRNLMEISGIEDSGTVTALRNSYQHYVPLHLDEAHPETRNGRGQGYSVKGSSIKRATGSNATVDPETILAHVLAQHETTIVRAEKNLVGMAVLHMALTNPNKDWWTVDNPPMKKVIDERQNVFNPGLGKMMPNPNVGQVRYIVDPLYKSQPNVLVVKVNGKDRAVVFEPNNERAVRMATALKNLDSADMGTALRVVASGTRWMSAINTKYNPVFTIVNMARDLQGAAINLSSTEINGAQAQILNPATLAKFAREIYRYEQGKPMADPAFGAIYKEFRLRGGQTGFTRVYESIGDRAKDLEKAMTRKGKGGMMARGQAFVDFIGASNDAVENMIRVSAYKAALDRGMSKDRAAVLAKELTVNFNRRGAKTSQAASALYSFFNAAVQGNARLYETITGKWGKTVLASGLMLGVAQALWLAAGLDDEEREAIKDWEKKSNFIIPLKDGKTIKIPMPLGLHVLPNIGRVLTEGALAVGKGKSVNVPGGAFELLSVLVDAVNPVGSSAGITQMITPTLLDPVVQIAQNQGGLGGPVYRDRSDKDPGAPGYTLGRDSTSPAWKAIAWGIHMATSGGDEYARNTEAPAWFSPQPEALRAIPEAYLGGIWRETEKLLDTSLGLSKGELDMNRALLISRFAGDLRSPTSPMQAYYRNLDKVAEEVRRKVRMEEAGKDYSSPLADLSDEAGRVRREMRTLIEERRDIALRDADEVKAVEEEMGELMREFNALVREAR